MDAYPESAFFNVGTIDDVIAKANAEAAELGAWHIGYIWFENHRK